MATDEAAADSDRHHMTAALALSRRNLGSTWPNPSVGCVLVRGGRVVGRGVTAPGGRPHGEASALAAAGGRAKGATAYVTLEPCAHRCADALAAAGVRRVVVPLTDPDPRTAGKGLRRLEDAGIEVDVGLMADEAGDLHAGFLSRIVHGRPLVTLKVAASLDGRTASASGDSRWITGRPARRAGHGLRASHDAVLVGRRTADIDNPRLTCRLEGLEGRSPVRIVADSDLRLPPDSLLVTSAGEVRTWIVCGEGADRARAALLGDAGVGIVEVARDGDGRVACRDMLEALAARGITRLLVEGGATLAAGLVRENAIDRIAWFQAPVVIGGDGLAALAGLGVGKVCGAPCWRVLHRRTWQRDAVTFLARRDARCSRAS